MSVIQIKNIDGKVWSLYPAVMVSRKSSYAVTRVEMRRIFQCTDDGVMEALRTRILDSNQCTKRFSFRHFTKRRGVGYRMGCQFFNKANTAILKKWALA